MSYKQKINQWKFESIIAQEIKSYLQRRINEIPNPLDFMDFDICFTYIKRKQTKKWRFKANKITYVLELIHTNTYGSFLMTT